ncbi:MAG: pitrilysin family protein [Clostridia bacterium]
MFDQITLQNGLRIIGERIPHFRSVSVGLWFKVGSQNEVEPEAGISHFIEHMLFKGTEKRTARQIAEVMDAVGGQLNAFTSKECTCFYAKVVDEYLPLAMDVLSDLALHSTFAQAELEREKGVVLEEINMAEDSPEDVVSELIMLARYGDQPLARPILGSEATVSGFTRADVLAYYKRMYRPDNCVLAVAGNYDWQKLIDMAQSAFGDWRAPDDAPVGYHSAPAKPAILRRDKEIEQLHLCIGYPGVPQGDDRLYPLSVVNTVFGGAMSSRLFQTIREEKGMAYSVYSYPSSYQDTGIVVVYAGASMQNGEQVLAMIREQAKKMADEGMTMDEFTQAREQLKGNYVLGLESTSSRMNAIGRRLLLLSDTQSEEQAICKINAITYEQVCDIARMVLRGEESVALVGRGVDGLNV